MRKRARDRGDKRRRQDLVACTGPGEAPATAASSARGVMPGFGKVRCRWLRAVRCDGYSCWPIPPVARPSAACRAICSSCGAGRSIARGAAGGCESQARQGGRRFESQPAGTSQRYGLAHCHPGQTAPPARSFQSGGYGISESALRWLEWSRSVTRRQRRAVGCGHWRSGPGVPPARLALSVVPARVTGTTLSRVLAAGPRRAGAAVSIAAKAGHGSWQGMAADPPACPG